MNPPPLQFTPGSFYRTRDGRKAVVYAVYRDRIHGAVYHPTIKDIPSMVYWIPSGENGDTDSRVDLISPWTDPIEFDVTVVPPWIDRVYWGDTKMQCWWMGNSDPWQNLPIPNQYAPRNADKTKTYRIDRQAGKLVPL